MASKFDEEKRVLINDLSEEKAAHMQTLELLAEERRKSSMIPKYEQELSSLRSNFEDVQKMLIQSQKKQVEERNKTVVSNQQIEHLQMQLEQMQEANDKTQTLLEESMQELDEHKALIQSNPNLQEIQEASSELSMLRERVAQLESALTTTQEENARMTSLLATAQAERDRAVEEMRGSKTSITTLQAQLEEAMFNLEMSSETIKDLNTQLAALGVSPTTEDSPALTRSTATLLEQENSRLMEDINSLKANLVATETRLTRTTKQLNAFRLSASHDAKRNQATITSLQHKIAGFSDFPSPSSTPEPPASPSPTPKQQPNGVYESDSEGENGDTSRIREAEENKREIEALQHQLRDAQAELEALRAKTETDARTIHDTHDLRMQYELSQTELEAMRADLERVEKELDRKQTEAYTLRTQLAEELESLHGEVSQLQEALRKEEQINADLTQELERERAKETSGGRQEEVDALREQLQRAQEAHDNLLRTASDDEVVSLRAKVDESEGEMEKLREEVERLKDTLETETHMNSELTKLVEHEKSNHSAKEAEINVLREKLRDGDKDLQVQAQQYHQKMEQSAQELSELKMDLDRITTEYNASTNQMTQAQGELVKSREQFLELQGKLEKAMLDNMELEKKLEERMGEEEAETLRSQLQQSHDDFEKATDANAELERQLEHALSDLDALRAGMKEGEGKDEQLDALREELNQLLAAKAELAKKLEEEKSKNRARNLQVGSELEELQAQMKENEKIVERLAQAKDNLEKATSANAELEKQYNAKQVELNTHRAQALAQEREMELLRVELLQSKDVIEKVKDTSLDLERRLEEERNRNLEDENKGVDQEQIDALKLQLKEVQDALESEIQTKLDRKQGEQDKVKREADDLERRNTEFERHLALLRAEEGVLRAQLQAAQEEIAESNMLIEEQEREKETVDQEREELASMLEGLQRANEELANKVRKYETLKLNGKQESPRKVTIQEDTKSSSESDQEAERESEEIIEDEADEDEVERDEEAVDGEEQEEEEIEDDEEEEDEKEELVAELQEQIKDEQQRTTNLVQAIYTLQIELQQEKAKQGEMDTALVELQKGNQRLTQEVYDLRNAWTESSFFNSSFTSDKGISSLISEIPKESSIVSPTSSSSPRKKDGNTEWDGLENEIKRAAGLRAVALRTILEDLENAKDKDVKMANLRTQQFQLIDKLNDTEVELAESRHIVANLQAEFESAKRSIEEHKSAKELASKLAQLEQHNAALNARLEIALAETAEVESGHTSKLITLESQIVNREQHNASINERLKEALGLATDAEEEHIKSVFALEDKIEKLEAENESLISRMKENDNAALTLIAAQEDYRKLVSALEDKQGELQAYNANLNKELENAKEEINKLLEENDTLERNSVSLAVHTNTTARDLEDSVASAKSELAEANEELEILRSERESNIKALKMLVAERENANEEVRILLAEREKIMEKLEDLERLADNAEVLEVRNSGLQRQIEDLETQLRESARTKREISGPLSRSSSFSESFDAKRMVSESESLEHRNAALATMTDELRQRINELESNPDEIETLSQEVATLEEERNALAVLNRKLEKECKKLREQVKSPKNAVPTRNVSQDSEARVLELEEEIDTLREKIRKQEELHESFVVSTEEDRAVNHSNFVNLQTALRDEKDNLVNLEKQISALKLENAKLQATSADDKSSELREVLLANSKLREELVYTKSQCAQLKVETDALGRIQTEMGKLKDEMNEERHKAKKWKKENKELKEECRELKRDRFMERELTSSKIGREIIPSGELGSIKEEYATLRGECKVLREDRNIWREECSKAKDETKKWRDNVSALELEMREVKIVHHEEVQLIASLKRENELLRRDNEMLWEQMDAWGGLDGLGNRAKDSTNNTNTTNNINIDGISTILHPDSLNDASLKEDRSKVFKHKKEVKEGQQEDNNNKEEKEERKEDEEEDIVNTSEELTRSHLGTSTTPNSSSRASRVEPSPIPTNAPRLQPDYTRTFPDEQLPFEESGIDTQGVMFEAQSLAHYRTNVMILSQMEKLATQLHTLVQNARSTNNAQSAHHNAHLAHAVAQASAERNATLRLRDAYENDSQRIQEASLEALRAHVNGIKSVYNALSY